MQNVSFLPLVKAVLPSSWHIEPSGLYTYSLPKSEQIPRQGWKVFVSCHFFNAASVIQSAATLCAEMGLPFKFVGSRLQLATDILGKPFPRAEGAKAVVIFPPDPETCHTALLGLAAALDGIQAPPVLSGRHFANAPVYYRYGANSDITEDGQAYVLHPETGEFVPDLIQPWYETPPWIDTDPFQPDLDVDTSSTPDIVLKDGRYAIQEALTFSNSGGIYLVSDTTTRRLCCMKEGRPWMAPHPLTGEDAVVRLGREAETLKQACAASVAPEFIDYFVENDHAFLVRAYIEGEALDERKVREPFSASEFVTLAHALEAILELREILGDRRLDLSPSNIIFDGSAVKLIDFETVVDSGRAGEYVFGTRGFIAPRGDGVCPWRWGIQALLDYCQQSSL